MEEIYSFFAINILTVGDYKIRISTIFAILLIFVLTKSILWLIKKALYKRHKLKNTDPGNTYALFQIIKYVVWIIALGLTLETIGIKVTLLIASSAALLVGVGLGLQQTFNDVVSGIIMLSERSIKLGDILEIDGDIIKIREIGLRTSTGINRDDISVIIPNSKITTNKVINWSHQSRDIRFRISAGVAYGSDIDAVTNALTSSVSCHPKISNKEKIEVRLIKFNNSSIDFEVLFFCDDIFRIEKVKSDIRKTIHQKLIDNNITIPFPQMDVHLDTNVAKNPFDK